MDPPRDTDDVIRSFNPDTYIHHELDGKPLKVDKPKCWYQARSPFAVDYYGHREYQGRDAYGYYHQPQNLYKGTQVEPLCFNKNVYDNPYNTCNNPDYQVSDNRTNYQELGGKALDKSRCKLELELHLYKGKNVDSLLVSGKQSTVYELDADYYEDTISTSMNSTRFNEAIEFVRNYEVLVDHPATGVLSSVNLGVKISKNNIIFIYLKFQ